MGVEALTKTGGLILDPLYSLWGAFVYIVPSIVVALLVLILGYAIAFLIGYVLRTILEKLGLNKHIKGSVMSKTVGHTNIPSLVGEITKWFVFLIFLQVAVDVLKLAALSTWLGVFVAWLPNIIVAIIIFFSGVALAHYVDLKIKEHTNMKGMLFISGVLKLVVMVLVLLVGLKQIGIRVELLENSFLIILGSLGLGLALALGIGLGLGLRKEAEDVVKKLKKSF
jgi:hypothetical protein